MKSKSYLRTSLVAFAMLLMLAPLGTDAQTFKEVKSKGNSTYVLKRWNCMDRR